MINRPLALGRRLQDRLMLERFRSMRQAGRDLHIGAGSRFWAPEGISLERAVYVGQDAQIECNAEIGDYLVLRSIANRLALFDPFVWAAYAEATLILVATEQTRTALLWPYRNRAVVFANLGTEEFERTAPSVGTEVKHLELLFMGRLLVWKGVHLAIRALARSKQESVTATLTIVGNGPYEGELWRLTIQLNAEPSLRWLGHISQTTLFDLYFPSHGFLLPSLQDLGGTVMLEAQANGLPVICLDLGGPATMVSKESSVVVATSHATEESVVEDLAKAITILANSEELRQRMASAAIARARMMRWENRIPQALSLLSKVTNGSAPKCELKL